MPASHALSIGAPRGADDHEDVKTQPIALVSSTLGFNSGIEAFRLLVIAATMPWLILLARTRVYPAFRVVGACVTVVAAAAWFFECA